MYQKPISKDFLKNINLVLSGETTQKFPLSAELQKHAKMAANELKNIFLDEGVSSAEKKRDVIRQNLVAGLKECNCDATEKLVAAYEDLVWENYNEKDEEQAETVETEEVAEEEVAEEEVEIAESTVNFMLDKKVVLRRKSMKDGEAKAAAAAWKKSGVLPFKFDKSAAEKYRMPWKSKLVDGGVTWGPGYKKGQTRDVVVEQVETAETDAVTEANHIIEVTGALTDFVKELNEDEVRILKNLLAKH